ncbi:MULTISPECIES: response regulator transcription factor [Curtobacterium]|uniref:response regulator transcription factor n=1 Tax=Curtobacterium TaxID=2034 RepID=UPI000F499173|nr:MULTISPECIES: response regulator transcription factor [Curtobacterium]MBT1624387.1 response regulator transcription factor [Curtobacterium flaccumfaciens pv. oortii]ROQ06140.1 winged helix family two component transcriptional regulator [Curtobacterium sp. PhB171]ROQ22713.1 winged helix family two component transcriptional regulator [Curtobacterium sp. PhB170]ROS34335.1 winged helix family two component transcriptional regulator [Curtobacterium sp. PhB131]ROS46441.1 winged helix family two c
MANILVVEDDPEMGALVERGLTGEGHTVTVVTDGVAALVQARSQAFDAAAIDVMLPEMTGFEVCRRLREMGSDFPVILVTARDAVDDRVFGLDSGADDYLTKPFAIAELNARIRAHLRRRAAGGTTTVEAGAVRLDTVAVRASVRGRDMPLSVKEFSLLRFLMQGAPDPRTRTEVLEEVWGSAEHFDPTIVDQYVSYVRKKLQASGADVAIRTVRGVGYALEVVPSP